MNTGNMNNNSRPIKEYVHSGISTSEYFRVIHETIKMIEKAYDGGMYVLMDVNTMCIINDKIQLQVLFEDKELLSDDIAEFLKEITFSCVFNAGEDVSTVTEFLKYLDNSWSRKAVNDKPDFDDLLYWNDIEPKKTDVLMQQPVNNGETGVLDPAYWDTLLNNSKREANDGYPRLVNSSTRKEVVVDKDNFWIGKGDVDMPVNRDTISRRHAELITKGTHYFIMDNNSTNKTYVDGKAIVPNASVEIYNGARIKFADEEYQFVVDNS